MALAIAIAALAIAALAAAIAAWQLQETRKANAFPATVDLFREYRSREMVAARRLLSQTLPDLDAANGIRGLPDDVAQAALRVSHYLDNLGVLVAHDLLDPKLAAGFLGDSTLRLWSQLERFVVRERELRSPTAYLQYFEHLAATLHEVQPERVRAELRRWTEPQRPLPSELR
ncbi:MAG: hypothetical protein WBC33_07865 [Conexibacter sp.]